MQAVDLDTLTAVRDTLIERLDHGTWLLQKAVMARQAGKENDAEIDRLNTHWVKLLHDYGRLQYQIGHSRAKTVGTPFIDDFGNAAKAGGQNLHDFDTWLNANE